MSKDMTKKDPRDFGVTNPSECPTDTVQVIKVCPSSQDIIACGGWDETFRIYKLGNRTLNQAFSKQVESPIMDLAWNSAALCYMALGSGVIAVFNAQDQSIKPFAKHEGVICIACIQLGTTELVLTLGVNKQLLFWTNNNGAGNQAFTVPIDSGKDKVPNSMEVDLVSNIVLIGIGANLALYFLQKLQSNDNSVNYVQIVLDSPISCVRIRDRAESELATFNPKLRKIIASGTDGRVYVGELNLDTMKCNNLIVFKAHQSKDSLFSVNAMGFSKVTCYSLYTAGSDGHLIFWDLYKKGKLTSYQTSDNYPITACDLAPNQKFLVFATGYDWALGVWGTGQFGKQRPGLFVHEMVQGDHKV